VLKKEGGAAKTNSCKQLDWDNPPNLDKPGHYIWPWLEGKNSHVCIHQVSWGRARKIKSSA